MRPHPGIPTRPHAPARRAAHARTGAPPHGADLAARRSGELRDHAAHGARPSLWRMFIAILLAHITFALLLAGAIAGGAYWFWRYGPPIDVSAIAEHLSR